MADAILTVSDYIANVETQGLFLPDQRPRELPRRAETYDQYLAEHYEDFIGSPIPAKPTGTLPTVEAVVNCGRWVWACDCGGAQVVETGEDLICIHCGVNGWRSVVFPANRDEIETELLRQPGHRLNAPVRHWQPGWTLEDLRVRTAKADALIHEGITNPRALSIGTTRVWVTGETLTAPNMNTYTSNILDDLAGRNGVIEFEDSLGVEDGSAGDRYILLPKGTTAQRPGSPAAGTLRFNTTLEQADIYTGSEWVPLPTDEATFAYLNAAGYVGAGAQQLAVGNHGHSHSLGDADVAVGSTNTTLIIAGGTIRTARPDVTPTSAGQQIIAIVSIFIDRASSVIPVTLSLYSAISSSDNPATNLFTDTGADSYTVNTTTGLSGVLHTFAFTDAPNTTSRIHYALHVNPTNTISVRQDNMSIALFTLDTA